MRLVSDFDGVWTHPDAEAEAQGRILDEMLQAALPDGLRDRGREWLGAARAAVAAAPQRFGWAMGGRMSAFGDEDPFTAHNGLLDFIAQAAANDPVAGAIRDGLAARGVAIEDLGAASHAQGVARVVAARGPATVPAAGEAGRAMLAAGIDVVVVSNSPNAKLGAWFEHAGIPSTPHPETQPGAFRLRGASRKFELDVAKSRLLALGDLAIDTARPAYERILREERPDAVLGDVFSLDLALPLRLKRTEPDWRHLRVLWLMQPYTPSWLRATVQWHAGGDVECIEGGITGAALALTR